LPTFLAGGPRCISGCVALFAAGIQPLAAQRALPDNASGPAECNLVARRTPHCPHPNRRIRIDMKQQLITMLEMQDRMNRKVHPHWIEQRFAWYRALWIECGELIEHYGYKWWKHQDPQHEQVRLEVIDIWHFGMSMLFTGSNTPGEIAEELAGELQNAPPRELELREAVEELAAHTLVHREFSMTRFWSVMSAAGMTLDELFAAYVGKNVLNFFRQDHGYKDGSYRKVWAGREDNEHLAELAAMLDSSDPAYAEHLYAALGARYANCCGAPA